jgi:putative ATP-dependent endonuclease of OLD family
MIYVEKLIIKNFKCFRNIEIKFNKNVNIIVGNNEEGKSTILEALHLALSGMINGRPLRNEISEYFFNYEIKTEYIESIRTEHKLLPPEILIEVLLNSADTDNAQEDSLLAQLSGDGNYEGNKDQCGISFKICFNEEYQDEYLNLIQESLTTIPVEYYKIEWTTFARGTITSRSIPIKSVIIDSSSSRFQNGSDVYISKIIKDGLDEKEIVALSQAYRKLKEAFKDDSAMSKINAKITDEAKISDKNVSVSVDMSVKNSWETILMTYIENIPFQQIGKGEQCIIKTNLALSHKMALASNLILIEEPENHLSHSNLNILTNNINEKCSEKQLIITTHSNYIANKLRLDNIIFLSNKIVTYFSNIDKEDADYFYKLPGYDTL